MDPRGTLVDDAYGHISLRKVLPPAGTTVRKGRGTGRKGGRRISNTGMSPISRNLAYRRPMSASMNRTSPVSKRFRRRGRGDNNTLNTVASSINFQNERTRFNGTGTSTGMGRRPEEQKIEAFLAPGELIRKINVATMPKSSWVDKHFFENKLDRLKERLRKNPIPQIKGHRFPPDDRVLRFSAGYLHNLNRAYLQQLRNERNRKVKKMRDKHNCILLRKSFLAWLGKTKKSNLAKLFCRKRQSVLASEVFYEWRAYVLKNRKKQRYMFAILRQRALNFDSHRLTGRKRRILRAWCEEIRMEVEKKRRGMLIFKRICHRALNMAFQSLRHNWVEAKRKKALQKRALLHLKHRVMSSAFISWINCVEKRNLLRTVLSKLITAYEKAELFKGFTILRVHMEKGRAGLSMKMSQGTDTKLTFRSRFCVLL